MYFAVVTSLRVIVYIYVILYLIIVIFSSELCHILYELLL